ncbi:DUF927 domain-containing protein [Enterococcus dispar]|mgnify:CR=1 FL=1|uniref:DUF927 domain-containing protein n=1 Tax=Enterococcus dispar TaxID=44009 RepID=UPI0024938B4E|nr:DUF927 domain-containing protein [Enterococcus dispar]
MTVKKNNPTLEALENGKEFDYPNFLLKNTGILWETKRGSVRIATEPIFIGKEYYDEKSGMYSVELVTRKKGKPLKIILPVVDLMDSSPKKLIAAGIPILPKYYKELQSFLVIQRDFSPEGTITPIIGWQEIEGKLQYNLRDAEDGDVIVKNSNFSISQAGSYEKWRQGFQKLICPSVDMMVLVLLALVSVFVGLDPFLMQLGIEPFVLHIYDSSSKGKTTILRVIVSIFSNPDIADSRGLFRSHSSTINALTKLGGLSGVVVGIDDSAAGSEGNLTPLPYRIANAVDKFRLDSSGQPLETDTFRVVAVSTGEDSIFNSMSKKGGVQVRTTEVTDMQLTHSAKHAADITSVFTTNYGFLAEDFSANILENSEEIKPRILTIQGELLEKIELDSERLQRVSIRFATALYAGEILVRMGYEIPMEDIQTKLVRLLNKESFKLDHSKTAQHLLKAYVEEHKNQFDIDGGSARSFQNVLGRINQLDGDTNKYRVRISEPVFGRILSDLGLPDQRIVLKAWKKNGLLVNVDSDRYHTRTKDGAKYASFKLQLDLKDCD